MRNKDIAQTLYMVLKENPKRIKKVAENFHDFVLKKNLKKKLPFILKHLEKLALKDEKILKIDIETAKPLSLQKKEQIIKKFYPDKVLLNQKVSPGLLSGIIIKIQEKKIESNIKNNLSSLKEALWQIPIR